MNLLENYLVEVHEIKPYEEDWTKEEEFKGINFLSVDATWNCYGRENRTKEVFRESEWNSIKEKGYYMG